MSEETENTFSYTFIAIITALVSNTISIFSFGIIYSTKKEDILNWTNLAPYIFTAICILALSFSVVSLVFTSRAKENGGRWYIIAGLLSFVTLINTCTAIIVTMDVFL